MYVCFMCDFHLLLLIEGADLDDDEDEEPEELVRHTYIHT